MSVSLTPTQRDLLERLTQSRSQTGITLESPGDKRAAVALAKGSMVTLNVTHTQVELTVEGYERLRLVRDAERTARNKAVNKVAARRNRPR